MISVVNCSWTQKHPSISPPIAPRENCVMKTTTEIESVSKSGVNGEIKGTLEVIKCDSDLIRFAYGLTWDAQTGGKRRSSSRLVLNLSHTTYNT